MYIYINTVALKDISKTFRKEAFKIKMYLLFTKIRCYKIWAIYSLTLRLLTVLFINIWTVLFCFWSQQSGNLSCSTSIKWTATGNIKLELVVCFEVVSSFNLGKWIFYHLEIISTDVIIHKYFMQIKTSQTFNIKHFPDVEVFSWINYH